MLRCSILVPPQKPTCLRTILSQSDVIRNMNIEIGQGCCDGSKQGAVSEGTERGGVRDALRNRGKMPSGGDRVALAEWLRVPALRWPDILRGDEPRAVPMQPLPPPNLADRGHD